MKFLFIINPNSGNRKKNKIIKNINKYIPIEDYKIIYWEDPQQDIGYSIKNNLEGYDTIVAVGGDGTVNRVASSIINTNIILAIIPTGSGNGLARHLGIPMNIEKSIKGLTSGKIILIDTGTINNVKFLSTCGVGFDAYVSSCFAKSIKRGVWSYLKIVLKKYWSFNPEEFKLIINNTSIHRKALLIAFANSNQFGNNAFIAPNANIQDGILNITIVKPFPIYKIIDIVIKLFSKSIHRSRYIENFQIRATTLIRSNSSIVQYDGEPATMDKELNVKIIPKSLNVLVP